MYARETDLFDGAMTAERLPGSSWIALAQPAKYFSAIIFDDTLRIGEEVHKRNPRLAQSEGFEIRGLYIVEEL